MNPKQFALAVTLAASAFLATGCTDNNSNCVNGKYPDGSTCSSNTSGGGSGAHLWSKSGGFGGTHGGESGGS